MTLPRIHLNGTDKEVLLEEYQGVRDALKALYEALRGATLHSRDFYPLGAHAYPVACEERAEVFDHLNAVDTYAAAWVEHLYNQK
jgi:hypothetical protein